MLYVIMLSVVAPFVVQTYEFKPLIFFVVSTP